MRRLDIRMRTQESISLKDEYGDDPILLLGCLKRARQRDPSYYADSDVMSGIKPRQKLTFSPSREGGKCLTVLDSEDQRCNNENEMIDAYCHEQMCLWCYRIIDHLGLPREFVSIAMSYADRFLNIYDCDRATYKLTCMTALYTACKIHGTKREVAILPEGFSILSRREFTAQNMFEMEFFLLKSFQWKFLHPPTACANVRMMGLLLFSSGPSYVTTKIMDVALFLTEISICDRSLAACNPSSIAFASLLLAINGISQEKLLVKDRSHLRFVVARLFRISESSVGEIQEVKERLLDLYQQSEEFYFRKIATSFQPAKLGVQQFERGGQINNT